MLTNLLNHKRLIVAVLLIAILLVIGAFYYKQTSEQSDKGTTSTKSMLTERSDSSTLRLTLTPSMGSLPFYYAVRSGLADSNQVAMTIQTTYAQPDADTALQRHRVDAAMLPLSYIARSKSSIVIAIMAIPETWHLIASKQQRATATQKLKGKLVATTRYAADALYLQSALKAASLSYDQVYHPQINALNIRRDMVVNNQIDAAMLPQPWAQSAIQQGCKSLWQTNGIEEQWCLAISSKSFNRKERVEQMSRLIDIYAQAVTALNRPENTLRDTLFMELFDFSPSQVRALPRHTWQKPQPIREGDAKMAIDYLNQQGVTTSANRNTLYSNALLPN